MTKRRVVVLGKNRLAVECLRALVDAGDEVILAVADPSDDGRDGWQPSFRAAAEHVGVRVVSPPRLNEDTFVDSVEREQPDFLLSFQAGQLLRNRLLATARVAALNLHFGPLPRYRGVAPIAWALINGESTTGVTIHHISAGIDSGDVVASASVPIDREETGRTLYDKCTDAGVLLFRSAWPRIRMGEVAAEPQAEEEALYYNRYSIDFSRRRIRWNADVAVIANRARAFIFPPFQFPTIGVGDTEFEVTALEWDRRPHAARPGQVLEVQGDSVVVAAPGGRLRIGPLRIGDSQVAGGQLTEAGLVEGSIIDS